MRQESDGSLRVIDLLPAFLKLMEHGSEKVFVIDELDRSLHTVLTRALLDMYLGCCSPDTRAQLLITSHDAMLFDQNIFRRDEIWITERNRIGVSSLYSLCEYKDVRYDKDVRRSYLQGRFGGIPRVILLDSVHAAPAEVFVSDAKGACDEA
jgi:AAA15 family ATPase/GTPase